MNEIRLVGIDLGKNVFHIICFDADGQIVKRRKCTRPQLFAFFRGLSPVLVGMEACASAHYVARTLSDMGTRRSAYAGTVREAVPAHAKERLPRC